MTAVTEQHQAGLGGDAYILAWLSGPQKLAFINGTGPSPKLATPSFTEIDSVAYRSMAPFRRMSQDLLPLLIWL